MRLWVHGEAASGGSATLLRALLLADVITRVGDLRKLHVLSAVSLPDPPEQHESALKAEAVRLNIHPPGAFASNHDVGAHLHGPADLHIADRDADAGIDAGIDADTDAEPRALWIRVGSVQAAGVPTEVSESEPLAARLALLSSPYQEPVTLADETLTRAGTVVRHWRDRVAMWATAPSRPPHRDTMQRCEDALDDNLDTAQALAALHALETDPAVPDGAKFETFVYLDRIFGLDLPQDIGRSPG